MQRKLQRKPHPGEMRWPGRDGRSVIDIAQQNQRSAGRHVGRSLNPQFGRMLVFPTVETKMLEKRGRKSFADLESVPVVPFEPADGRPEPPPDLSEQEAAVWRAAVAVMPGKHFGREKWPLLIGYCRHVIAADAAWAMYRSALKDSSAFSAKELTRLQIMHDRETAGVRHGARHLGLLVVNRHARQVPRYAPTPTLQPWEL